MVRIVIVEVVLSHVVVAAIAGDSSVLPVSYHSAEESSESANTLFGLLQIV